MSKSFPTFQYRIDHADRVIWVDESWLGFARENGAAELTEASVTFHSVWKFISDDLTRKLYQKIHDKVRSTGQPFVLPIRCDSPGLFREMQLRILPQPNGELLYQSTLMNVKVRPPVVLLDRDALRAHSFLTMCSCCLNCLIEPQGWLEIEAVAQRFPGTRGQRVPQLRYTICPRCANFPANGSVA